jgi:serine/threonine-protein kinase
LPNFPDSVNWIATASLQKNTGPATISLGFKMGFLDKARSLFRPARLNVRSRFELLREAVHGTMSEFYMARDRRTGQIVGLKILDPDKTVTFESRFAGLQKPTEGQIARQFQHERIVKVLEHGLTHDGRQYLLMEYLDGPGLNTLIANREVGLNGKRVRLIRQMAEGLAVVHRAGFIHRDICPRNYVCARDLSSLKLIDFGLTVPATKQFMMPGNRTGTPSYMAPEIVRRRNTDQRLDIFALGVSAYQLCALQLPWPGSDASGRAAMLHDSVEPIPLLEACPHLNPKLAKLIMQCMSVDPDRRPQTADDLFKAVRLIPRETAD